MTNQTTDEAAVEPNVLMLSGICGYHHKADCDSCKNARECTDAEIKRLNAQLTAATRRADELEAETNLIMHRKAIVRAEQAERMLAERDEVLAQAATDLEWILAMTTGRPSPPKRCTLINWKAQMAITSIRSAASGEQG